MMMALWMNSSNQNIVHLILSEQSPPDKFARWLSGNWCRQWWNRLYAGLPKINHAQKQKSMGFPGSSQYKCNPSYMTPVANVHINPCVVFFDVHLKFMFWSFFFIIVFFVMLSLSIDIILLFFCLFQAKPILHVTVSICQSIPAFPDDWLVQNGHQTIKENPDHKILEVPTASSPTRASIATTTHQKYS